MIGMGAIRNRVTTDGGFAQSRNTEPKGEVLPGEESLQRFAIVGREFERADTIGFGDFFANCKLAKSHPPVAPAVLPEGHLAQDLRKPGLKDLALRRVTAGLAGSITQLL